MTSFFSDLIVKFDEVNKNGRKYIKESFSELNASLIKDRKMLGRIWSVDTAYQPTLLSEASHLVTDVVIKEDGLYGTVQFLNSPQGNLARALCEHGLCTLGPRGTGVPVKNEDGSCLITDFILESVDIIRKVDKA